MTVPVLDAQSFDADRQHWKTIRVYYEDTDFTGMVYHANYLRFFERGRSDMLRDAGVSHQALLARDDPAAFTLTDVAVKYKRAARIEDVLQIRTRYLGLKGARVVFDQTCLKGPEIIAEAHVTGVMIHPDGRPRRPPSDIGEQLGRYIWSGAEG